MAGDGGTEGRVDDDPRGGERTAWPGRPRGRRAAPVTGWMKRTRQIGLAAFGVVALMLVAAGIADQLLPSDWRPVEATVTATRIEEFRNGGLEWALFVDARYEVDGRSHEGRDIRMYSNPAIELTEAEQRDWPPGRKVELYYDAANPRNVSRWPDGGRQGIAVVAALMVPAGLAFAFLIYAVFRRR